MPIENTAHDESEKIVYTVAETACILRISPWAIYRRASEGDLPFRVVRIGSTLRIPRVDIEELVG